MAMMMAGRVLLVCALCVLWCGAVFGHAMEDYCGEGGGDGLRQTSNGGDDGVSLKADCGLLSTRMTLTKAVDAADAEEMNVTTPLENLEDNKLGNNTQSTGATGPGRDVVAVPPPTKTPLNLGRSGAREQKGISRPVDANDGKRTSHTNDQSVPDPEKLKAVESSSSSGSPGTQSGNDGNLEKTSERNESSDETPMEENNLFSKYDCTGLVLKEEPKTTGDKKNASHKAPTEKRGSPVNDAEIQTATPPPPPATRNEQSSTETLRPIQLLQYVQDDIESNNNSQTNSGASIAANQQNETSADHAESGPPSPTANGDAANNEAEKSTEKRIPNSDPAAYGAGTREEKQNENKDANPKETPVEATATETTTATTGDSDGSTAVSHTTSPLLLLLVVACAAAAAVVAA
ncbi:Mucin-associated surface protein (MASP), subgroup S099 [Trypanosoma cruzi]|nr:Mucin-associated surface protein (MASP), subgroup S099 [Trypanosoma cruzi]